MHEHLHLLRCPISHKPLRLLRIDEILHYNELALHGKLHHVDGTVVRHPMEAGLISIDERFIYLMIDQIVALLPVLAIVIGNNFVIEAMNTDLRDEKRAVQAFYDEVGWRRVGQAVFTDGARYDDLRPVVREYLQTCNQRIAAYCRDGGSYLLDAASGPIQFDDYLHLSDQFRYRVCVDLSLRALQEAAHKLGDRGVYLLADITNLPIKDGVIDHVLSLHTIYHVPADEQLTALDELIRVLKPAATAVVVYTWGRHAMLVTLLSLPRKLLRLARGRLARATGRRSGPTLYYFTHNYGYFAQAFAERARQAEIEVRCWRSLSTDMLKLYVHRLLFGRRLLRWVLQLEERAPNVAGRLGQYAMFVIRKRATQGDHAHSG